MDYQTVLDDLKARFGDKRLLTPDDIAPLIQVTAKAQANQRARGTFPIPLLPQGAKSRKVLISIYALAEHLAGEGPASQPRKSAAKAKPADCGTGQPATRTKPAAPKPEQADAPSEQPELADVPDEQSDSERHPPVSGSVPVSRASPKRRGPGKKKKADSGKGAASGAAPKMKASEVPFDPGRPPLGPLLVGARWNDR